MATITVAGDNIRDIFLDIQGKEGLKGVLASVPTHGFSSYFA